jgi:hypothetical protein
MAAANPESIRLQEANQGTKPWRQWGPYLSERQWGTVREDYSSNGDAWNYFTHDQARSRAYLWGEDGLAGLSDDKQTLCFALAVWNGVDPILKERLFGLTNSEGNHGEDVKEYYFYIDSTPTHSYMKYLYKYPQAPYPYDDLVKTNAKIGRFAPEYELLDTGVFDTDHYFDIFVEYAKAEADEILIRITACNRGDRPARLHLLPHLWFRNTWTRFGAPPIGNPHVIQRLPSTGEIVFEAAHPKLGAYYLYAPTGGEALFTENETNRERLFNQPNEQPYVKDAFHRRLIHSEMTATNPNETGSKSALHYKVEIAAKGSSILELRLSRHAPGSSFQPFDSSYSEIFNAREAEADDFYDQISPKTLTPDERLVMRQALAGMLWSKQYYYFDLERWLKEHGDSASERVRNLRNSDWLHMLNDDVISMPDKWEYPWYAAWDLAFHTVALAIVDMEFAKSQLLLMLHELYLHPNGQVPAYEWNFSDVNPPVHAWATLFIANIEKQQTGEEDPRFLKLAFQKLLMNFTWWVNRKDRDGRNVFEGGFLGLDNIGIFDRSAPLPTGGYLEQADGTAWMAFFSQCMLQMSLLLAPGDSIYEDMAQKFVEHFFRIAGAMDRAGLNPDDLWDDEDGFFYDLLRSPDGGGMPLKIRSIVGLLPLCATAVVPAQVLRQFPRLLDKVVQFCERRPDLIANIAPPRKPGANGSHLLAIIGEDKLRRVLARMLDEDRFFSPHGIRSLSRWHLDNPYILNVKGRHYEVQYMPAESNNGMFGGNSNWRGPVWMPINALIVRSLLTYYQYYGDDFKVECPTGSGVQMTLFEVAHELSSRLASIFLADKEGKRPVFGGSTKFQSDPHWRDYILFYEYFHGDDGAGIGASHQTGWTGIVAKIIELNGYLTPEQVLAGHIVRTANPKT